MRPFSVSLGAALVLGLAGAAVAQDTATWNTPNGIEPGDEGYRVSVEGLNVSWAAHRSYSEERRRVVAEFCNNSSTPWEGGMRLATTPPQRAHRTIRVPADTCVTYDEILPTNAVNIYVMLKRY